MSEIDLKKDREMFLSIKCPVTNCRAPIGTPCFDPPRKYDGQFRNEFHAMRKFLAPVRGKSNG